MAAAPILCIRFKDNYGREHIFFKKEDIINYLEEGKRTAEDGFPVKKMLDNLIDALHRIPADERGKISLLN